MNRRGFVTLLGGATAWPLAARAQGERRRRVAVVMNLPERDSAADRMSQALVAKLRELGWTQGRNLDLDFRRLGDRVGEFSAVVEKIVELQPDVIVGRGGSVALALQQGPPDRIDSRFEQPGLRMQIRDIQSRLVAEKIDWEALA